MRADCASVAAKLSTLAALGGKRVVTADKSAQLTSARGEIFVPLERLINRLVGHVAKKLATGAVDAPSHFPRRNTEVTTDRKDAIGQSPFSSSRRIVTSGEPFAVQLARALEAPPTHLVKPEETRVTDAERPAIGATAVTSPRPFLATTEPLNGF